MPAVRTYFQDKVIILLLTAYLFLATATILLIVLRLGGRSGSAYIVQYRAGQGIGSFLPGGIVNFLYFIAFIILTVTFHCTFSYKVYPIHKQFSVAILSLGLLLVLVTAIVSNALVVLR